MVNRIWRPRAQGQRAARRGSIVRACDPAHISRGVAAAALPCSARCRGRAGQATSAMASTSFRPLAPMPRPIRGRSICTG